MRKRFRRINLHKRIQTVLKILLILVLLFGLSHLYQYLFTITQIDCHTLKGSACPEAVQAELNQLQGENLVFVNFPVITQKIIHSSIEFEKLVLFKSLPGKVSANLSQAYPIAQVQLASHSAYLVVLDNFGIINSSDSLNPDLPLIEVEAATDITLGELIHDKQLLASLRLVRELDRNFLKNERILVATDSTKVNFSQDATVLFNPQADIQKQIHLYQIINNSQLDPVPSEIDVRFDKPIIRY